MAGVQNSTVRMTGFMHLFLLRSIGFEPGQFNERGKRVAVLRMVPLVERNYNLVELGPRGTAESHLVQEVLSYAT